MDRRKLNAIVAYISRSISAAALMIWGVFNVAILVMQFLRRPEGDESNWSVSILMCLLFGVLPFLLGSWMLYRNVSIAASSGRQDTDQASTD
jgi:heme/copper-type cytochrome/quinol oxidase subunit 4